jgi:hypothetical protein
MPLEMPPLQEQQHTKPHGTVSSALVAATCTAEVEKAAAMCSGPSQAGILLLS